MTRLIIEDTWYVETDELKQMVLDAIGRIEPDICVVRPQTFRLDSFSTNKDGACVTAEGEARVEGVIADREADQHRVEFETRTELEESDGIPDTASVTVRLIEETL